MGSDDGALLTPTQREFLRGEKDVEWADSRGRTLRSRMRERLQAGLQDFGYLSDPAQFDDRDVDRLREDLREEQLLTSSLVELVTFVYRLEPDAFESIIETGARRGVERFSPDYEVEEVNIAIRKRGRVLAQAREKMERNDPLTDKEIRVMLRQGDLSAEDLQEYVQNQDTPQIDTHRRRYR